MTPPRALTRPVTFTLREGGRPLRVRLMPAEPRRVLRAQLDGWRLRPERFVAPGVVVLTREEGSR